MYYGQFNPPVDKILHEKYFPSKLNGISIEAGALDGIWDSNTNFFEKNYNWKTINIEPLNNMYEKLVLNRPKSINLNYALGDNLEDTYIINYKHSTLGYDWGNASVNHTDAHKQYLERECGKNNFVKQPITVITYEKLIEDLSIQSLDLFSLDVEGNELKVIDGMKNAKVFPSIFVIEHGHMDPQIIIDKLAELPVKYSLDMKYNVNSFFILEN